VCVRIFQKYFPEISRTPGKIFSGFFRPIKFSRDFFSAVIFFWFVVADALRSQSCAFKRKDPVGPSRFTCPAVVQDPLPCKKRINLFAARMSGDLGDAKTMMIKLSDGTADTPVSMGIT
jgi:hypothetical protein